MRGRGTRGVEQGFGGTGTSLGVLGARSVERVINRGAGLGGSVSRGIGVSRNEGILLGRVCLLGGTCCRSCSPLIINDGVG